MPFSRAFASANKAALLLALAATGARSDDFTVHPDTVVAGRVFSVTLEGTAKLREAAARWNGRRAPFFPIGGGRWRALLGVGPLEPAGTKTVTIEGAWARGGPFLEERPFAVVDGAYPVSRVQLAPDRDALFSSGAVDRDAFVLASLYNQPPTRRRLWRGPFVWPSTGVVSSPYGARRAYGDRPALNPHTGVDIAAPRGTPVVAPQGGRVLFAGRLESFGHVVLLDHGHGVCSYYLHMVSVSVEPGERVKTGRRLGLMGAEGIATGPHVHWSLTVQGERVDPLEWTRRDIR